MYLIAFVCLFWVVMFLWYEPLWNLDEMLRFFIPAALTIIIACDHVRLNGLRKRVEALEQKLAEQRKQDTQ